jgi:outer membrane protein assembly factor BamD
MTAVQRICSIAAVVIITLGGAMTISSCSASKGEEVLTPEMQFAKAMREYDKENYLEAIEAFKTITVQYQGSTLADGAQFYIGESRFQRGEYILAAAEYDMLIRSMQASKYLSTARYKRAMSYYMMSPKSQLDQKYTKLAIDDFQTFLEFAPKDSLAPAAEAKIVELTDKLAEKIFESGMLYFRREFFKAAIVYFDNVVDQYHDTHFADAAMYWKARCLRERKDYDAAIAVIDELVEKFPATTFRADALELRTLAEKLRLAPKTDDGKKPNGLL